MDKHFILTLGRSGSNSLVNMLNQHPEVINYGEVLGDWNELRRLQKRLGLWRHDDAAYLDALLGDARILRGVNLARTVRKLLRFRFQEIKNLSGVRTVGIKDFSLNLSILNIKDYFESRPDIKVIGLSRPQILDRMLSSFLLGKTGVVARTEIADKPPLISLDTNTLVHDLETIDKENLELDAMLATLPASQVLRIDYKELYRSTESREAIMSEVFRFLNVADVQVNTRMRKIVENGPLKAIENLEECRKAVSGTRFEDLFYAETPDQS
ncbi:sulfotransferase [Labrenzia sp. PHM005]|uniref:sulfotransferase n=1 Tax=Labrenzia sp. PHM005 TaxID=2590016 RepID=UPI0011409209|nr:sulfotransferase [Labrenzia sp. PHM005]QDG77737.1 sulfotransferase [Labrenzia sp. PHM005]